MTELHFLTIAEASARIKARTLSPVELTDAFLARVKRLDHRLNSHLLVLEEQAREDAKRAESEIAAGWWKGPLHGIPIGLKDIYNTAGIPTTGHSALLKDHIPTEDAFTVRLLREAGAVITSKLATWEFAIGGSSFDLPWPPARNPWDVSLDPSGSSSGSGVAVAAGLCMGAMGSDTGGSIRGPAAWCGIAGLKPTYGFVSRRGILPLSFSFDHAGPMCWTSEDCALMMQVLACHDPMDPGSASVPAVDFTAGFGDGLKGLRVGVVRHFFEKDLLTDPETIAALESSITALRGMGAIVGDVTLSPFGAYSDCGSLISRAEAYAIHQHWLRTSPELYGAFGRHRLMAGAFVLAADYINAQRERSRLVAELAETMKTVDVVIFPTARCPARPIGEDSMASGFQPFFNRAFNVTGSPALSICNGFSQTGLPLALQIGGRPFEDALVLKVGDALERALATRIRRPVVVG
ncbi:MAG TPA: Asp-tRNA(Asn)/Glu-tRNA(Gln) amidotransferase GatCAB subunit A [Acetobacteraceae bacterium]|jgi:aspartyl-tRNA(Asn)/glutamyl-tRNA(Gln) amidotransferase subunit A|nr:Asp-tRNA(Asn)/Glu-tRNA(Gln) amidotransferase GatCAB subunit A [Acetobacteraceae bacterium]